MALTAQQVTFVGSGNNNRGGALGTTKISSVEDMFFDPLTGAESAQDGGYTDHRLCYLTNLNNEAGKTVNAYDVKIYGNVPAGLATDGCTITWQVLSKVTNGTVVGELEGGETQAPSGSFTTIPNKANAITAATILEGGALTTTKPFVPIWIKRVYTQNASRVASSGNTITLNVFFDTAA